MARKIVLTENYRQNCYANSSWIHGDKPPPQFIPFKQKFIRTKSVIPTRSITLFVF